MAATSGYQAGIETNVVELSYLAESTWGTLPSSQFQAVRFTSESLKRTKTRQRPGEVPVNREAPAALTTQVAAGGSVGFALSYGTFDDWLAGLLGADWGSAQTINGSSGDITLTNVSSTSATLSRSVHASAVAPSETTVAAVSDCWPEESSAFSRYVPAFSGTSTYTASPG